MNKKDAFKVMFLYLFAVLMTIFVMYSILNKMFDVPLPLLAFVQIIFIMTAGGSVFIFLVNVVALFGEDDSPEKDENTEVNTEKHTMKNENDKWIKLK